MKKYFNNKKIYLSAIIFLLITAFFLRILQISKFDLWRDEAFTVTLANKSLSEFFNIALKDTSSFGHNFFLFLWTKIFGIGELAVRIPSLLFSMGTFLYLLLIAKRYFQKYETIFILSLYSINIVSIYYAQEARGYSMLMLLITASFYYYSQLLEIINIKNALLFILFAALSFYTHNLSIFLIAAYFAYTLINIVLIIDLKNIKETIKKSGSSIKKWFAIYSILFLAILPWLLVFISQSGSIKDDFWLTFDPINSSNESLTGLSVGIRLFSTESFTILDSFLNIFTLFFFFIGSASEILNFKKIKLHFSFFFWGIFFMIYFGSFITPMLYVRYISFLTPFMLILIYKGISALLKNTNLQLISLIVILTLNINIYVTYQKNDSRKPDYSKLTYYLENNFEYNDIVIHIDAITFYSYEYYSSKTSSTIYDPEYETPFYVGRVMLEEDDFTRDLSSLIKFDRLWVIESESSDRKSDFEAYFTLKKEKNYKGGLKLELWENTSMNYKLANSQIKY